MEWKEKMNKRNTIQKQLVLNAVNQSGNHPTAEEVYKRILVSFPGISKATVYRNLSSLAADGLLLKLNIPGAADKYDRSTHSHYHALCRQCGTFFDLAMDKLPDLDLGNADVKDFTLDGYDILFKGTCRACMEKKARKPSKDVFNIDSKKFNQRRAAT